MNIQPPHKSIADAEWRILIIEVDEDDFILNRDMLKEAKGRRIDLDRAATYEAGQTKLTEERYDVVFVDNDLGVRKGIDLIRAANERGFATPLILFTGKGSYEEDIEAMRAGATLYMSKNDLKALSLERFIRYAIVRKHTETALQESEEKFAKAFRANPAGQLITRQSDGVIVDVNESYERLLGYSRAELVGHKTIELNIYITPQERNRILDLLKKDGRIYNMELTLRNKSGSLISVITSLEAITIGGEDYLLSTLIDNTERKQAETVRQTILQRVKIILSILYGGILVLNNDNRVEFANQAFCELFAFDVPPDALVGKHASEILQVIANVYTEPNLALARISEILANGQPVKGEEVPIRGGRLYLRDFIPIIIDGKIYGRVWHHNDITDRKQAELSLRESEVRLRLALDAARMVAWEYDPATLKVTFSDNIEKELDLPSRPEDSNEWNALIHPDDVESHRAQVTQAIATGSNYTSIYRYNHGEQVFWLEEYGQAVTDPASSTTRLVGVVQNITERKRNEAELQNAHEQLYRQAGLAAAMEERSRLARELHDSVAQALYSISLFIEAARMALATNRPQVADEHLSELALLSQEAMSNMRLLIFELRPPVLEQDGLASALRVRLDMVETKAGYHAEFELKGEIQLTPEEENELYRIALEALNNMLKHSQADQVKVRLMREADCIRLSIEDNGKGFDLVEAAESGGQGLRNIHERAANIGAICCIETAPSQGTKIIVEVMK